MDGDCPVMQLFQEGTFVTTAEDLKQIPERQSFHYEPDFCGRMNVVLDELSPAQMKFGCDHRLVVGELYTLSDGQQEVFQIRISRVDKNRYTATVVAVGQTYDTKAPGGRG
jgi:hypothetical protein